MSSPSAEATFYRIPLVCEAAPQIGCGCRAKPVLAALERRPEVMAAWLSRSGSVLAVQWRRATDLEQQLQIVTSALGAEVPAERIIDPPELRELQDSLESSQAWFRGDDVDSLSREEAGVIAARIAQRVASALPIEPRRLAAFEKTLAVQCSQALRNDAAASQTWRTQRLRRAVFDAAAAELGPQAVRALETSPELADHRPSRRDGA